MKHVCYIVVLTLLVGCSGMEKPKKPDNLIGKDKMSEILYDLYILNAAKGVNRKILEANGIMPLDYLYEKYNIDSLQFAESNTYHAYDTKGYLAIIERVKNKLEINKDFYEKLKVEEQIVKDSINQADIKENDTLQDLERQLP